MPLTKGCHVHLAMVGYGPLCDAKVQTRLPEWVTLRLMNTTSECGQEGQLLRISRDEAVELVPEQRLTRKRVLMKVLAVTGSVAASIAIGVSNPVTAVLLLNPVSQALFDCVAWEAVPRRLDYLLLMTCPDRLHCFSDANRTTP